MKDFFKGKAFKAIICLFALVLGIIIYQAARGNYASLPEAVVGTVVTPIVNVSSKISNTVGGFFNMFLNAKDIEEENKKLKAEISELYKKSSDFEKYKSENEQLKKALEIKELRPDFEMQSAAVIGRDNEFNFYTFTVNKGSLNGIKVNNPVITNEGLVGIISHVAPTYSVVTTVLSPDVNIGIYNARTMSTGVVGGSADLAVNGNTKLKLLPRNTTLQKGDIIETSGDGGVYPEGIILGTIQTLKAENSGVSMYGVIKPVVDVTEVSDVVIIKKFSLKAETENAQEEEETLAE